jgi:hypothetical protein
MSPVRYELGFYIPEDGILHIPGCGSLKFYIETKFLIYGNECIRENKE